MIDGPAHTTVRPNSGTRITESKCHVKEESETDSLDLTRPFCCVIRMAGSRGTSQEIPMNNGIIRDALTTTLALELEYREPSIFRETETKSARPTELQPLWGLFEDEFTISLEVI